MIPIETDGALDRCIRWAGFHGPTGYGKTPWSFSKRGNQQQAHRWVFEKFFGPIPRGVCVLHRCDVRDCINPRHLFLGTQAENVADCVGKGRARGAVGERNKKARLNAEQVIEIRRLAAAGVRQTEIAKTYDMDGASINHIVRRRNWRHVP